jgi:hypothetical protein
MYSEYRACGYDFAFEAPDHCDWWPDKAQAIADATELAHCDPPYNQVWIEVRDVSDPRHHMHVVQVTDEDVSTDEG